MIDDELLHYARQILLTDVDLEGQQKLKKSHVIILGLGGLGSPVALYLGAAGVGKLTLVDGDLVDPSNLHRQVIHSQTTLNCKKVESARDRIRGLNPFIQINIISDFATENNLDELVADVDCIADCTDRFSTRFMINRSALRHRKPIVSGAALGVEGQLTTLDCRSHENPCYACLVPDVPEVEATCAEIGVLGPVVGAIGTIQAIEVIGVLLGWSDRLVGRMMRFNAKQMEWRNFHYQKDANCPVCRLSG